MAGSPDDPVRLSPFQRIIGFEATRPITHAALGLVYEFPGTGGPPGDGFDQCDGESGEPFDGDGNWNYLYATSDTRNPVLPVTGPGVGVNVYNGRRWSLVNVDLSVSGAPGPVSVAMGPWAFDYTHQATTLEASGGGTTDIPLPDDIFNNFSSATSYAVTWSGRPYVSGPMCFIIGPVFGPPGGATTAHALRASADTSVPSGTSELDYSGMSLTINGETFNCVGSHVVNEAFLNVILLFQKS